MQSFASLQKVLTDRTKVSVGEETTHNEVVHLVREALGNLGLKELMDCRMKIRDVSGLGGSKTFHVTGHDRKELDIAVHLRSKAAAGDTLSEQRMESAANQFAKQGVACKRLAQGTDWFIERWEGKVVGSFDRLNKTAWWHRAAQCSAFRKYESASLQEMGSLLAKIHQTPTLWFEEFRGRMQKRHPSLRKAGRGSHIWYFGFQQSCLDDLREESISKWIDAGRFFSPLSPSSARVVSCHGDFHPANVVRGANGLSVIDFETGCVGHAVLDLAWSFKLFITGLDDRRVFTEAYLRASGEPAEPEDVNNVMFDAECYSMFLYLGPLWRDTRKLIDHPEYDLLTFRSYAFLALQARESPELKSKIIDLGLTACLVEQEA